MDPRDDDILHQELAVVSTVVTLPTYYDSTSRVFFTNYRGHSLTVGIPKHYPSHSDIAKIEVRPRHDVALVKCKDVIEDVLPGEYMLIPLCMAFRDILDRTAPPLPPPSPPPQPPLGGHPPPPPPLAGGHVAPPPPPPGGYPVGHFYPQPGYPYGFPLQFPPTVPYRFPHPTFPLGYGYAPPMVNPALPAHGYDPLLN